MSSQSTSFAEFPVTISAQTLDRAAGRTKAKVLYRHLCYWQQITHRPRKDGNWIIQSVEYILQMTGLTRNQYHSARLALINAGLIVSKFGKWKGKKRTLYRVANPDDSQCPEPRRSYRDNNFEIGSESMEIEAKASLSPEGDDVQLIANWQEEPIPPVVFPTSPKAPFAPFLMKASAMIFKKASDLKAAYATNKSAVTIHDQLNKPDKGLAQKYREAVAAFTGKMGPNLSAVDKKMLGHFQNAAGELAEQALLHAVANWVAFGLQAQKDSGFSFAPPAIPKIAYLLKHVATAMAMVQEDANQPVASNLSPQVQMQFDNMSKTLGPEKAAKLLGIKL